MRGRQGYLSSLNRTAGRLGAVVVILTGTTGAAIGGEPDALSLSPKAAAEYRTFKNTGLHGYFAMSPDGRTTGYSFCRSANECGEEVAQLAKKFCSDQAGGTVCETFAESDVVVWPAKVTFPAEADVRLVVQGWHAFPAHIEWSGEPEPSVGWLLIAPGDRPTGWLKFSAARDTEYCFGSYTAKNMGQGGWTLSCPGGVTVSGTYERKKDVWQSRGADAFGRKVRMTVYIK